MSTVSRKELEKTFHLNREAFVGGRAASLDPVFDGSKWHLWAPIAGKLQFVIGEPIQGQYWAKKPAAPNDVYVAFIDFFYQHGSWPDVISPLHSMRNDIFHLGACWAKLELYFRAREEWKYKVVDFVQTDIEYIFVVCRSIYDLSQKVIANIWRNHIEFTDPATEKKRKGSPLPPSFAAISLDGDKPIPAQLLTDKYGLPPKLATVYAEEAPFFKALRDVRVGIEHYGKEFQYSFDVEGGFAVDSRDAVLSSLYQWPPEQVTKNGLAPLNPFLAHVINKTFGSMDRLTRALAGDFAWGPAAAPGYHMFLRGYHVHKLAEMPVDPGDSPWFRPPAG